VKIIPSGKGRMFTKGIRSMVFLVGVGTCFMSAWAEEGSPTSLEDPSYLPNTPNGPQAQTRPELDSFGLVMEAASPTAIIAAAEDFSRRYPASELLPLVQLREMQAEMSANSYAGTIAMGRQILQRSPDNLEALILMAGALPNFPPSYSGQKQQILAEALQCRQKAEELLEKFHLPEGASPREFAEGKSRMRVSLHASAGFAALVGGQNQEAIREYQWVLAHGGESVPSYHLYLGFAYQHAGDPTNASLQLHKAIDTGSGVVRERATEALNQLPSTPR